MICASDAYPELYFRISVRHRGSDTFRKRLQHIFKFILFDTFEQKQKFIPAVAYQNILLAQTRHHCVRNGFKNHITDLMTVFVINTLEIIDVRDRNSGGMLKIRQEIFKINARIRPCQRITVKIHQHEVSLARQCGLCRSEMLVHREKDFHDKLPTVQRNLA